MKVAKEEIAGLMVVLERYVERAHPAEWGRWHGMLETIQARLSGLRGVVPEILVNKVEPEAVPVLRVRLDEVVLEQSVAEVVSRLIEGSPAVSVSQAYLDASAPGINPMVLQPGEEEIVTERIRAVLGGRHARRLNPRHTAHEPHNGA